MHWQSGDSSLHRNAESQAWREPSPDVLAEVDRLFEAALQTGQQSLLLRLFLAQYVRLFRRNNHVEMLQLKALMRHNTLPFDIAFFVAQRRRDVRLEQVHCTRAFKLLRSLLRVGQLARRRVSEAFRKLDFKLSLCNGLSDHRKHR